MQLGADYEPAFDLAQT